MPNDNIIIIGAQENSPTYVNGKIVKIHEENIYDIRLLDGRVETYVENVSEASYNSGEYVVLLIIGFGKTRVRKIIGRGRKMIDSNLIKEVLV